MPTSTPTSHYGMSFVTPSWLLRSSRCSLLKSACSGPDYPKARLSSLGCGCRILALEMTFLTLEAVRQGQVEKKINPHLAVYIHITNLHTTFEFCIPCIQDYGVALKGIFIFGSLKT